MASINFNPFGGNWFSKPPNPLPLPSLPNTLTDAPSLPPNFAAISLPNPFRRRPKPKSAEPTEPGPYEQLARQVLWECETLPDHRHTPEVDKILADNDAAFGGDDDSVFVRREDATDEEVRENAELVERLRSSPVVQFMARAEEILDKMNEMELKENERPYHKEDWEVWKNVPNVIGLDGRPMPRKAQKTREEADDKFWDFARQFFFGLWNFRQRPYPPGKPIDAAQSIGYKNLERRYYDFRLAASATALLHKLQKGIPPWVPLKGFEKKTYKQLQEEAIESKRRDLAVLEANDGLWPGAKIPSHALFLWASGSELTTILEQDHMPNKYIPKYLRKKLAEIIPGLRPWEVLSIEQAMDRLTFNGEWYREPLGSFTTGPPYLEHWNRDVMRLYKIFDDLNTELYEHMENSIAGFDKIMEKIRDDFIARTDKMLEKKDKEKREARKKAGLPEYQWPEKPYVP
eukprot:XP_025984056.1 protein TIC 56, chloroplastic isoform X2 [Glycine max]